MYSFSPNPSGKLHIGGLRTFYAGYKLAKENHKHISIRFDDVTLYPQDGTWLSMIDHLECLEALGILPDTYYREARTQPDFTLAEIDLKKAYITSAWWTYDTTPGYQNPLVTANNRGIYSTIYKDPKALPDFTYAYPKRNAIPAEIAILRKAPYPADNIVCKEFNIIYPDVYRHPNNGEPSVTSTYETSFHFAYRHAESNGWVLSHSAWQAMKIFMQGVSCMIRGINAAPLGPVVEEPVFDYFKIPGYSQRVYGLLQFEGETIRKTGMDPKSEFAVKNMLQKYSKQQILDMLDFSIENDKRPYIPVEDFLNQKVSN